MNARPKPTVPAPSFVLGTAQLGMPYGISNVSGMPTERAAFDLIAAALKAGVTEIDTARAYGESEARIGAAIAALDARGVRIVTKLAPLNRLQSQDDALAATRESLALSRETLRRERLDTLLLHRASDRLGWGGTVWDLLRSELAEGRIGRLGVSVQSPAEAMSALDEPAIVHIQLPYNVLDTRWDDAGVVAKLRDRPEVTVHVRSALLQGLLTLPAHKKWPNVDPGMAAEVQQRIRTLARTLRNSDVVDLCLAFVRGHEWIDGVVLGVETTEQLRANLALFSRPPLDSRDAAAVRAALPRLPAALLDPAQWPHSL